MATRLDIIKYVDKLIDDLYGARYRLRDPNESNQEYNDRIHLKEQAKLKIRAMLGELE